MIYFLHACIRILITCSYIVRILRLKMNSEQLRKAKFITEL